MCPLADIYKQMGEKMIASKSRLREEWEKLGGMTLISPPCFKPPETPMTTEHFVVRISQISWFYTENPSLFFQGIKLYNRVLSPLLFFYKGLMKGKLKNNPRSLPQINYSM